MSDENVDVRNAAMFALGQFAVHLQVSFFLFNQTFIIFAHIKATGDVVQGAYRF